MLCEKHILPPLREEIQQQDEENQIVGAQSLVRYLGSDPPEPHVVHIFGLCARILQVWSQPVLDAWFEVV